MRVSKGKISMVNGGKNSAVVMIGVNFIKTKIIIKTSKLKKNEKN